MLLQLKGMFSELQNVNDLLKATIKKEVHYQYDNFEVYVGYILF